MQPTLQLRCCRPPYNTLALCPQVYNYAATIQLYNRYAAMQLYNRSTVYNTIQSPSGTRQTRRCAVSMSACSRPHMRARIAHAAQASVSASLSCPQRVTQNET